MDKVLHIAEGLTLPLQVAARTTAILAQKGAGKTYTGLRMTEELLGHGQQVVAMDPTGVWWGLRAPGEGKHGKAFEVIVLGGEHADAPLEPTAGRIVAEFAVSSGRSLVLDLSGFGSNAEQDRFAADFMETLYRAKASERSTLHLMVDEADSFAPQRPMPGQQRMLGAAESIVRRGRSRGLGITMISQRPAVLNKNVLSQADLLIALRVVGQHDHGALLDWAALYGSKEQLLEFSGTLPRLETGEAWFWSPSWLGIFKKARVTRRVSFDSSRTPEPGERAAAPKMAEVSLESLSAEIQASVERVREHDPKALRAEVAKLKASTQELRKQLEEKRPALDATHKVIFRAVRNDVLKARAALVSASDGIGLIAVALGLVTEGNALREFAMNGDSTAPASAPSRARLQAETEMPILKAIREDGKGLSINERLAVFDKAQRKVLTALAQYQPRGLEKRRLALIAGYAVKGGGFNNALSSLRTGGWIEGSAELRLTESGSAAVGDVPALPTGAELLEYWCGQLTKAEREILRQLSIAPAFTLAKAALAVHCNYEAKGGGFNNALSRLRTLCLIEGKAKLSLAEDLRP